MKRLFGASSNFYSGTSYGRAVTGASAMVRAFDVHSVTPRNFVLERGLKMNKKSMKLNLGNYFVDMFETADAATQSLIKKS